MPSHSRISNANTYESIDQGWICGKCSKTVSTSNYVYGDVCTCTEPSAYNFGGATQLLQTERLMYHYDNTAILYQPQSYASSAASNGRGPEGPEREVPRMLAPSHHNNNTTFLPVTPELGHNEAQHQRSSSFRSDMSYQMRRFFIEQAEQAQHQTPAHNPDDMYATDHPDNNDHNHDLRLPTMSSGNKWLSQEIYIQRPTTKGSGKTKSWESGGSAESGLEHWDTTPVDPILGIGTWTAEREWQYANQNNNAGYSMCMSGMSEAIRDIDRR